MDAGALSPALRAERERNLDRLHEFWVRGVFPTNRVSPNLIPIFKDEEGRLCAVSNMVDKSGHRDAVEAIARRENYLRLAQMRSPELDPWIAASGFSKAECAMIQGPYTPPTWSLCPCPELSDNGPSFETMLFHDPANPGYLEIRAVSFAGS